MAIETVNARYEGFIFDGENSRDYGVYVQDVEVFGAPTRDVEMISIPGRDGEYAMDNGRFNNIQIKYVCALGADSQSDFNTAISDLRNWLASKKGYKRLEDEINTGEYRMAVFKDGLEVPTLNKKTGTFDVVFDCKPQRFLKSGETAVSVSSGGTITNPTFFDAKPLLQVWGYGDIDINGGTISINDDVIGVITLANGTSGATSMFPTDAVNTGDALMMRALSGTGWDIYNIFWSCNIRKTITAVSHTVTDTSGIIRRMNVTGPAGQTIVGMYLSLNDFVVDYGTSDTETARVYITVEYENGDTTASVVFELLILLQYSDNAFSIECRRVAGQVQYMTIVTEYKMGEVSADSTKSALGEPLYFDLDVGEAYKYEDTEIVSVNNAVSFPVSLPVLAPGANAIEYDNTVTQFKVVPRWWKV